MVVPSQPLNAAIAVTRFGLGARPGELDQASHDPVGWLVAQVRPEGADQPDAPLVSSVDRQAEYFAFRERKKAAKAAYAAAKAADAADSSGQAMAADPAAGGSAPLKPNGKPFKAGKAAAGGSLRVAMDGPFLARAALGATTAAPFRERWALFWFNHFTVSGRKLAVDNLVDAFEREAIRPHIFGRFPDLAAAVLHHPAMLIYLDQTRSVGPGSVRGVERKVGLNENLARETLELHTLGAESGYTQADVTEFARALTGFTVGRPLDYDDVRGRFQFDADAHDPGPRTVLGRRYDQRGAAQGDAILRDAANDPRTAAHISAKLAAHFVADDPPPALVAALKQAWIASHGDLAVVARALVSASEAWTPAPAKLKTPYDYVVSCYRAAGQIPDQPKLLRTTLTQLGQKPWQPPSPKGWADEAPAWAAPNMLLDRLGFAQSFAATLAVSDPLAVAKGALGARLTPPVALAMQRAQSRSDALALLFMSPEFQRR